MAAPVTIPSDVDIQGNLTLRGNLLPGIARATMVQDDFAVFGYDLTNARVWDSATCALIGSPGTDDLGLAQGAFATGNQYITAGDLKAAGATTRYARLQFCLPPEYVAGETVRFRCSAGMLTTVADGTCTLDVEAYKTARTTLKSGSDLYSGAAQDINSVTFADINFDLVATTLSPGDWIDVRIAIACNDAATVTAVTPAIGAIEFLLDIKG